MYIYVCTYIYIYIHIYTSFRKSCVSEYARHVKAMEVISSYVSWKR